MAERGERGGGTLAVEHPLTAPPQRTHCKDRGFEWRLEAGEMGLDELGWILGGLPLPGSWRRCVS